jgi:hypothetical protein
VNLGSVRLVRVWPGEDKARIENKGLIKFGLAKVGLGKAKIS